MQACAARRPSLASRFLRFARAMLAGIAAVLASTCATPPAPATSPPPPGLDLFAPPAPDDLFSPLIGLWQASERWEAGRGSAAKPALSGALEAEYLAFNRAQKERVARDTLRWIQTRSLVHYRPDPGGDQWPTLAELFARGEDDCDGLELLAFNVLRGLGFGEGEIYRAVLRSENPERYHMVTLWFDADLSSDPYVIDPTGWIAHDLVRLSSLPRWRALRLFDEDQQFTAREISAAARDVAGR
jgi:hypothetical protein